jgi:hypothetical protein
VSLARRHSAALRSPNLHFDVLQAKLRSRFESRGSAYAPELICPKRYYRTGHQCIASLRLFRLPRSELIIRFHCIYYEILHLNRYKQAGDNPVLNYQLKLATLIFLFFFIFQTPPPSKALPLLKKKLQEKQQILGILS